MPYSGGEREQTGCAASSRVGPLGDPRLALPRARAPARCDLRPARSGSSPDAPPPPPRVRWLHFLFL